MRLESVGIVFFSICFGKSFATWTFFGGGDLAEKPKTQNAIKPKNRGHRAPRKKQINTRLACCGQRGDEGKKMKTTYIGQIATK
jgi:hypothetical protein